LEAGCVSIFRQTARNLMDPFDWVILNHWAAQKQWLAKICTWEQI